MLSIDINDMFRFEEKELFRCNSAFRCTHSFTPQGGMTVSCVADAEIDRILNRLSKKKRKIFEMMRTSDIEMRGNHNIFLTNNITIGKPIGNDPVYGGIYPTASRLNHCCVSNTSGHYDERSGNYQVVAVQDIKRGEQICAGFGGWAPSPKSERRHELLKKYGMFCQCKFCNIKTCDRYEPMNKLFGALRYVICAVILCVF